MAGDFISFSNYLADLGSLASGFESAALGGEEAFGVIGILEANDGIVLSANPTLSNLFTAYKQAMAFGNRNLMKQYGAEIARIIRDHASAFNKPESRDYILVSFSGFPAFAGMTYQKLIHCNNVSQFMFL